MLLVIEKDALALDHLRRAARDLWLLPLGAVLVEYVEHGLYRFRGLSRLTHHEQGSLRLVKPQLEFMVDRAAKHSARDFYSLDCTYE